MFVVAARNVGEMSLEGWVLTWLLDDEGSLVSVL
jgi:hypothetical protein